MAISSPLEEYMADLISQHKLKEEITDVDYENELAQSQAEEALALSEIDQQPFSMAARSYNMDPSEWVGREAEARQKMKQAVSANYLNSRAKTVNNKAQGKKAFTQDLLGTLTRLHSVNQRGISSLEELVPRDAGLRSQLVFNPATGTVEQVAKNIPDEDAVRNQELADYLQVPVEVVTQQRTKERMNENDHAWKIAQRQSAVTKNMATAQRQANADARAEEKAQFVKQQRQGEQALKFSTYPKEMVDQIVSDPDTPPGMKVAATLGDAIRKGSIAARAQKKKAGWEKTLRSTATAILYKNSTYLNLAAEGEVDPALVENALKAAEGQLKGLGATEKTWSEDFYKEDYAEFGIAPEVEQNFSLDQIRQSGLIQEGNRQGREERKKMQRLGQLRQERQQLQQNRR